MCASRASSEPPAPRTRSVSRVSYAEALGPEAPASQEDAADAAAAARGGGGARADAA